MQKYLNVKKVPQLFVLSGAGNFNSPQKFPWSMSHQVSYSAEGGILARYILDTRPNAKIGVLYQNDDLGKDLLRGLIDGLGERRDMVVAQEPYQLSDPSVDTQVLKIYAAGPDVSSISRLRRPQRRRSARPESSNGNRSNLSARSQHRLKQS